MTTQTNLETVTFTLNNKEISVPKGWTVMQAASKEGVKIPHFCWHPGLSIAGVCRFCMVKVEGRPKLEIACNLTATPGMVVTTETDEVKQAHKWALEFHLVNHPLDCPICDQAGECGLQDYYMSVGKYQSQMNLEKVLKPKALDVGGDLVLDTERCILCSRCVRFEKEVTKTGALGIFDRGDRAIISTYEDKKINHNYTTNLVDICPVGAFTSKDFRFKQRVWFLQNKDTTCIGCSTGCQIKLYGKPDQRHYYRVKPRHSTTNGHWMCDDGRHIYSHLNPEARVRFAYIAGTNNTRQRVETTEAIAKLKDKLKAYPAGEVAVLISAQHTVEEYKSLFGYLVGERKITRIFDWRDSEEDIASFDGILKRGDQNPNTYGLEQIKAKYGLQKGPRTRGLLECLQSKSSFILAIAPELTQGWKENFSAHLADISGSKDVVLLTSQESHLRNPGFSHIIPLKCFHEKRGTFLNFSRVENQLNAPFPALNNQVKDLEEIVKLLKD